MTPKHRLTHAIVAYQALPSAVNAMALNNVVESLCSELDTLRQHAGSDPEPLPERVPFCGPYCTDSTSCLDGQVCHNIGAASVGRVNLKEINDE